MRDVWIVIFHDNDMDQPWVNVYEHELGARQEVVIEAILRASAEGEDAPRIKTFEQALEYLNELEVGVWVEERPLLT